MTSRQSERTKKLEKIVRAAFIKKRDADDNSLALADFSDISDLSDLSVSPVSPRTTEIAEKISWIKTVRKYDLQGISDSDGFTNKLLLDDNYESISTPEKLKTQLLKHQTVSVKAMIDLENERSVKIKIDCADSPKFIEPIIQTNAGVNSEHLGSGKTYEILALICLNPIPKKIAEITTIGLPIAQKSTSERHGNHGFINNGFSSEVRKMYTRFMKQTFIFVGKSVMSQWYQRITKQTSLKVYSIENVTKMREFHDLVFVDKEGKKKLSKYDVILIKNGIISGKFDVPELRGKTISEVKNKAILNVFGELFENICVARVVLDDFDNLDISSKAKVIPALFTWFVSATKRAAMGKTKTQEYYTIKDILLANRPLYVNFWCNSELFNIFNISCNNDFINASTEACKIRYYVYKFINPNDNLIGLLGVMGTDDSLNVMEMLNGDAVGTAAAKVGIKTVNVPDIFEKILDKKWATYRKNILIEHYVPKVKGVITQLPPLSKLDNAITDADSKALGNNVKRPGPLSSVEKIVKFNQSSAMDTVNDVYNQNAKEKAENGIAIQRVRSNLQEGECPITMISLKDASHIVITKCCNIVISGECVSWAFQPNKYARNKSCPNCRAEITEDKLILVDKNINIDDIINEEIEEPASESEIIGEMENLTIDEDELDDEDEEEEVDDTEAISKSNCMIDIIKDERLSRYDAIKRECDDILIHSLLEGAYDKGEAPAKEKKVLIYTSHYETTKKIEKKLFRNNIGFARLQGTPKNIKEITNRYWLPNENDDSLQVLLISGPKYCSGLDLQNTTDLVFMHNVIDEGVKSQIAGRAARYARKYNLNIHFLLYPNELNRIEPPRVNNQFNLE
jgi:hypothetical protein